MDYADTFKPLNFTGDSVQTISVQISDDGISEPPETFLGLLSSADGVVIPPNVHLEPNRATATIISENGTIMKMKYMYVIFCTCTDVTMESTDNNSTITVLVMVLVSILAFLIVAAALTVVTCFVFKKKNKRRTLDVQEHSHIYESVLPQPPNSLVTFSEPAKLDSDLYDEVKKTSCNTAFELTDNKAYDGGPSKPPPGAEVD